MQFACRHRLFGVAGGSSRREPEIGHGGFEPFDRIVARGIQLISLQDKRGALLVKPDAVDHAPFDVLADVEVSEFGFCQRAAVYSLVAHLDPDVFAAELVLHLVHDVGDRFHGFGVGAFAEVLTGRE
nr:hypothetical protein [Arthrobacter sp. UCD-GKA]